MSPPQETGLEQSEKKKQGILLLVDVPAFHTMCISCFTHCCDQASDKKGKSEEKGFILSNGLRGNTVHPGQECEGGGHIGPSEERR